MRVFFCTLFFIIALSLSCRGYEPLNELKGQVEGRLTVVRDQTTDITKRLDSKSIEPFKEILGEELAAVYLYDSKRIMVKALGSMKRAAGYNLLHRNFLNIAGSEPGSLYLSGLIPLAGETCYFVGLSHEEGTLLFLFQLNLGEREESYALFDSRGALLLSNRIAAERLKELSQLAAAEEGQKESFFAFKFFKEYDNYYYKEEIEQPEQP